MTVLVVVGMAREKVHFSSVGRGPLSALAAGSQALEGRLEFGFVVVCRSLQTCWEMVAS